MSERTREDSDHSFDPGLHEHVHTPASARVPSTRSRYPELTSLVDKPFASIHGGIPLPRPITVKIKRLGSADDLPLPARMTEHAAGFDIAAAVEAPVKMSPGEIRLIPCGFAMAVPHGYEAQVRPRSGLASRHGITMVNAPGTIDSDYRGEVQVPMINLGREPFTIERGMRIAQMLVLPVPSVRIKEVDDLDATKRGKRGFGHTGH